MIPVNVMAPTMQVACKAFIAPNSAARSPKERYTRSPQSKASPPRRCILVECPKRGDGQDWDGSHLLELLPKCDILIAARDCQGSWPRHPAHNARTRRMKSSSNPPLRLWVIHVIPAIPACAVRPKSGATAAGIRMEHRHRDAAAR